MARQKVKCLNDEVHGFAVGRGLCRKCHKKAGANGTLHQYPLRNRIPADVLDDYQILSMRGMTKREIAAKLGYADPSGLEGALQSAKRG